LCLCSLFFFLCSLCLLVYCHFLFFVFCSMFLILLFVLSSWLLFWCVAIPS
jgi:hypothetical protein